METKDMRRLVAARMKIDADIKVQEAALKEKLAPLKAKRDKIEEKLGEVINKSGAEGCMKSTNMLGYTVYASETPKYKLPSEGRDAFVEWVLADDEAEQQIDPEHKQLIRDRIEIFGNTLKKDPIDDYRLETGAESIGKEGIKGGKLPAGIQLHVEKKVNFRKSA